MDNPTIYKFPKKVIENPDGTTTEIEKSLRKNKDVSIIGTTMQTDNCPMQTDISICLNLLKSV